MDSFIDDYESAEPISLWRQNHGNWLLGLVAVIGVIGSLILAFRGGDSDSSIDTTASNIDGESQDGIEVDAQSKDGPLATILVKGANSDEGQIMLAIYDAIDRFNDPSQAVLKAPRPIKDGNATWVISAQKLPQQFAIAAFHDENGDGVLNRSVFGIPMEPYGFSNQAKGKFGPPSFEQAVLSRSQKDESIEVFLGATSTQ